MNMAIVSTHSGQASMLALQNFDYTLSTTLVQLARSFSNTCA